MKTSSICRLAPFAPLLVGTLTSSALAQITINGVLDPEYGAPVAVQTVQTQFGDAAPPGSTAGSELDAAYAQIMGGRLYLFLSGNQEPNFNKLDVFIDSQPGGENTLSGTPDYDFSPDGGTTWISSNLAGLTFDAGFEADHHLFTAWGSGTPFFVNFIDREGGASAMVPGSGEPSAPADGLTAAVTVPGGSLNVNASGPALTEDLLAAIDNTNNAGVLGGTGAANAAAAAAVNTGMEFSISLADLGNPAPGSLIKISAMINNGDHNFLSNQILGGVPAGTGNLGGDGAGGFIGNLAGVDFNAFPGNQYFSIRVPDLPVIPEPSILGLLGNLLIIAYLGTRRRRPR